MRMRALVFSAYLFSPLLAAVTDCDISGVWKHTNDNAYSVSLVQASPPASFFHVTDGPSPWWHSANITLYGSEHRFAAIQFDNPNTKPRNGTVSGPSCNTISWSDKTTWKRQPPPPPLPPGTVDPRKVETVLVVQSCHLDIGFADFSTNIINRFFHTHFPQAIATASQLRARGGQEQLVFTVHPLLLDLYFNCTDDFPHLQPSASVGATPPEPLQCPDKSAIEATTEALRQGVIVWDAAATSAEPEVFTPEVFVASFGMAARLAGMFNRTASRTMSQRDVPGMTRGVIPLLNKVGVQAVSVGANGGSSSPLLPGYNMSRRSYLSTPFVWRDPASNTSVLAHWHPGGYGRMHPESGEGLLSSCVSTIALPTVAMCYAFRGDNQGPPQPPEVLANWEQLQGIFPHASTITPATFDDYFDLLSRPEVRGKLPVFEGEVADSWVYGVASDPLKLAAMRAMFRHHHDCVGRHGCVEAEPGFASFTRLLVLSGKHTWGGHTIIIDQGKDTRDYSNANLEAVRWTKEAFTTQQHSWDEQRLQLWAARTALGPQSPLGAAIDAELSILTGPTARTPIVPHDDARWQIVPPSAWGDAWILTENATAGGGVTIRLDPATGAVTSLVPPPSPSSPRSPRSPPESDDWASAQQPLARFAYVTHSQAQGAAYVTNYTYGPQPRWAPEAWSKPGLSAAAANASVNYGRVVQMWRRSSALSYKLELAGSLHRHYGSPSVVYVVIEANQKPSADPASGNAPHARADLAITLQWLNKTTTRLPESIWLEFKPDIPGGAVEMDKLGSSVRPSEVTVNGSMMHVSGAEGVSFTKTAQATPSASDSTATNSTLRVIALDAPLVAVGPVSATLNPWTWPTNWETATAHSDAAGAAFNLFNNLWGCNYVYWYPWRNATANEDDSAMTFRWRLTVE